MSALSESLTAVREAYLHNMNPNYRRTALLVAASFAAFSAQADCQEAEDSCVKWWLSGQAPEYLRDFRLNHVRQAPKYLTPEVSRKISTEFDPALALFQVSHTYGLGNVKGAFTMALWGHPVTDFPCIDRWIMRIHGIEESEMRKYRAQGGNLARFLSSKRYVARVKELYPNHSDRTLAQWEEYGANVPYARQYGHERIVDLVISAHMGDLGGIVRA